MLVAKYFEFAHHYLSFHNPPIAIHMACNWGISGEPFVAIDTVGFQF